MAAPYYKKSHKAWYVNLGKPIRLGTDEAAARAKYQRLVTHTYTVGEVLDLFLAQRRKDPTQRFYRQALAAINEHRHLEVADLRVHHVQGCRNVLRAAKTCFRWAKKQGHIDRNPIEDLTVPAATTRGDEAYLLPEEWARLRETITDPDVLDIADVLYETGCRPQEARRVEARHLDRANQCWVFPKAESKRGIPRIVHLSDRAYNLCCRRALRFPTGPLFRCGDEPWTADKLCKKFPCRPYDLRHSWITNCLIKGLDIQTVAVLAGHTDLKMISRIYQHLRRRDDYLKEAVRRATA